MPTAEFRSGSEGLFERSAPRPSRVELIINLALQGPLVDVIHQRPAAVRADEAFCFSDLEVVLRKVQVVDVRGTTPTASPCGAMPTGWSH